jgi:hypothetical protein
VSAGLVEGSTHILMDRIGNVTDDAIFMAGIGLVEGIMAQ